MSYVPIIAVVVGGLLVLAGLLVFLGLYRYWAMVRRVGAFTCDLRLGRLNGREPRQFAPGVASYGVGKLEWYRAISLNPTPAIQWPRNEFQVLSRLPAPLRKDEVIVRCQCRDASFDLLMTPSAYAGLASWLEAAPPTLPDVI
ncbi:MAG: DUF2550 domain-containing protein [Promicromonosporaceae bacterium]|nr:DUF2550 domain-containing protein [Promicromonosporaceae bacterium]